MVILFWCGFVKLMLGDYHAARDVFERAYKIAERNRFEDHLAQIYCYLSLIDTALGDFDTGRKLAESGLGLVRKMGNASDASSASIGNLQARALSLCMLGETEKALEDISNACQLCEAKDNKWLAVTSLVHAGMIHQYIGENEKALMFFEKAEALCKENRYTDNELLCRLARIALAPELPDRGELRREIAAIMDALKARATVVLLSPSYLLIVQIEQRLGNAKGALQALENAIAIDEKSECIVWWKLYGRMIMPTLIAEFAMGKHLGFLSRVFACMGDEAISRLRRFNSSDRPEVRKAARELTKNLSQSSPQPIKVKMLGNFELIKGGETIDAASWKSKKALFIMKYLAAHHSKGFVPREVLMELLWPDKDSIAAAKNLNTALTSLRKTLEPEAKWGYSSYIKSSGESLRVHLQGGSVDYEEFLSKIKEAERARINGDRTIYLQRLHEAEALYAGDFLAEDPYDDWCQAIREDLRRRFVELLILIAREYEKHGDMERSVSYLEKVASIDPGREEICRRLMEQYHHIGNRSGLERAFKRCRDYLSKNLDLAPSRETVELYKRLHTVDGESEATSRPPPS